MHGIVILGRAYLSSLEKRRKLTMAAGASYWGVFWIDASNEENVESGFASVGQQVGKGANFAAGMHWLLRCTKPWLLILDNADDPEMDISRYFPARGNGHILITTRNPGVIEHATAAIFASAEWILKRL
jgi:hypothetical protein